MVRKGQITAERESELLERYRSSLEEQEPDVASRNLLIEAHLPLIRRLARKIFSANRHHVELDDLVDAGCVGMIAALDRFDAGRKTRVSTYCVPWIKNEMHKHVRAMRYHGTVSEGDYKALMKLNRAISRLRPSFNATVDFRELSGRVPWSVRESARLFASSRPVISLETPVSEDGKLTLEDQLNDECVLSPAEVSLRRQASGFIEKAMERDLTQEEMRAVDSWFFDHPHPEPPGDPKKQSDAQRYQRRKGLARLKKSAEIQRALEILNSIDSRKMGKRV